MKNYNQLLLENVEWAKSTFDKIDKKMSKVTLRSRDKIVDGCDENGFHIKSSPTYWTAGFWGGLNWLLYDYTKNEEYLKTAKKNEELMDEGLKKFDALHHDVGFMWHILSGASYTLTGDPNSRIRNLYAATSLMSRYVLNDDNGFIVAWNGEGVCNDSIIDCLMNLPLLYWASEQCENDRFLRVARAHVEMAINDHLRPDGSVIHRLTHDREKNTVLETYGGQGYEVGSSWSRGQAWAVYGLVIAYMNLKDEKYLNAAKRVANYFIANCCDDWLPRVDFRAPAEPVYYDSTAGACTACGLIELAKLLPENEGGMYMNAAINILRAMDKKFANYDPENDHLLDYGTVRYPIEGLTLEDAGVHISIIYGDFFYTEAVLKLLGARFFPWGNSKTVQGSIEN